MSDQRPKSEAELLDVLRAIDVRAPEHLHERIQAMAQEHAQSAPRGRRRLRLAPLRLQLAGAAGALAALAIVLVIVLGGSGGSGGSHGAANSLDVSSASTIAFIHPSAAAPAENPGNKAQIRDRVGEVSFPYWEDEFGWRTSGAGIATIDGRSASTVFYTDRSGQRIAYAILAGTPAPTVDGGTVRYEEGVPYRFQTVNGVRLVTWTRAGHLCVMTAPAGISDRRLLELASWDDGGLLERS